jgi:comEA protein
LIGCDSCQDVNSKERRVSKKHSTNKSTRGGSMNKSILNKIIIAVLIMFTATVMVYGHALAEVKSGSDTTMVNINEATVTELAGLNGIGKTRAEAVIAYRSEYGKFESVDDIKKVKGVGNKTFENIRDKITVR